MYRLDHIAYAVKDLEASIKHYHELFGFEVSHRETIETQGVELAFLDLENTKIELLTPCKETSTLQKFLERRGEGIHHVCYEVSDIEKELSALAKKGVKLIDTVARDGAHNTLIAFIHPSSTEGVLTELCQYR